MKYSSELFLFRCLHRPLLQSWKSDEEALMVICILISPLLFSFVDNATFTSLVDPAQNLFICPRPQLFWSFWSCFIRSCLWQAHKWLLRNQICINKVSQCHMNSSGRTSYSFEWIWKQLQSSSRCVFSYSVIFCSVWLMISGDFYSFSAAIHEKTCRNFRNILRSESTLLNWELTNSNALIETFWKLQGTTDIPLLFIQNHVYLSSTVHPSDLHVVVIMRKKLNFFFLCWRIKDEMLFDPTLIATLYIWHI